MKHLQSKSLAMLCAAGIVLLAPIAAFAGAPEYQYILDNAGNPGGGAPVGTLNDVCALTLGTGTGSGSVISVSGPSASGVYTMAILTANHVATAVVGGLVDFGQGINTPGGVGGNGAWALSIPLDGAVQTYKLTTADNNLGLTEDISVMQAQVNPATLAGPALAEFNLVKQAANQILLAPFAQTAPLPGTAAAPTNIAFSTYGYGFGSVYNAGTAANLAPVGPPGAGVTAVFNPATFNAGPYNNEYVWNAPLRVRRFENNTFTSVAAPAGGVATGGRTYYGSYYQPLALFNVQAPSAGGTGDSLPGDSGSPMMTGGVLNPLNSSQVQVTPDYLNYTVPTMANPNPNNNANLPAPGVPINVNLSYTDYESAVFVNGTDTIPGTADSVGFLDGGVPLLTATQTNTMLGLTGNNVVTQGSYEWAYGFAQNPLSVPEPGTLSLLGLGSVALLCRRARG
jgi:hypothetical protein